MTTPTKPLPPDVVEALRRGNKIEAIKLMRRATRTGLAEAKGAIEAHDGSGLHRHSESRHVDARLSPGEVPKTSNALQFVIALVVAVIAIWISLKYI